MYCQSCGTEIAPELSFCNRCGARVSQAIEVPPLPPTKITRAAWAISAAMTLITLGGFAMVLACILTLLTHNFPLPEAVAFLMFFLLLVVLVVDLMLGRQLSKIISHSQRVDEAPGERKRRLKGRAVPPISDPRAPLTSVTEGTTRFFEPAIEQKRDTQSSEPLTLPSRITNQ